jgi:hypothetical protein
MACGTPVAAYPVTAPADVVVDGVSGALDDDLAAATPRALCVDRDACRAYALRYTWRPIAPRMLEHATTIDWETGVNPPPSYGLPRTEVDADNARAMMLRISTNNVMISAPVHASERQSS